MPRRTAVLAVLFLLVCGGLVVSQRPDEHGEPNFCWADGIGDAEGHVYGRSGDDCRFVDEDGEPLTEIAGEKPCCAEGGMVRFGPQCE